MSIIWKRVPRKGFIFSHWLGEREDGATFKIYQRVRGGRTRRIVSTYMANIRDAHAVEYPNVAAAKKAAEKRQ